MQKGLRQGADGIVPSVGNLIPEVCRQLCAAAEKSDWAELENLSARMNAVAALYQKGRNLNESLSALKAAMHLRACARRRFCRRCGKFRTWSWKNPEADGGTAFVERENMNAKPVLGLTMGDPAGIGPEICLRALRTRRAGAVRAGVVWRCVGSAPGAKRGDQLCRVVSLAEFEDVTAITEPLVVDCAAD